MTELQLTMSGYKINNTKTLLEYIKYRNKLPLGAKGSLALIITFLFSGFVHDLAVFLIKGQFSLLLTLMFLLFSLGVVLGQYFNINYSKFSWSIRALINLSYLIICGFLAYFFKSSLFISN